jgi:tetratricopeptide (TPR) repeat protein
LRTVGGMATSVTTAPRGTAAQETGALAWLVQWIKGHKHAAAYLGGAAVIGAVLFVWNVMSTSTAERNASIRLDQARLAVESRNYPLAASELSQLVENYAGTRSAEEGTLLLAKVRLAQGQSQVTIDLLTKFAPDAGGAYQAQAYGLLGAAYENVARPKEAAEAYERAAEAAEFPFLSAQFFSDAGRAWAAAGDTAKALAAYRAITTQLDSTSGVTEARVRIGELTKGAQAR